jgi:hypothetical protein
LALTKLYKFSADLDGCEFTHPNLFEVQRTVGFSRILIGAVAGEVELILDLCRDLKGPFGVLYVLIVSRRGNEAGRYQCPVDLDYDELKAFLLEHREYFEQDGRHHLWINSFAGDGQFVLDRHKILFAYGDVDRISTRLTHHGFQEAPVRVPTPHGHHYHAEFDRSEDEVLQAWDWIRKVLQPSDN